MSPRKIIRSPSSGIPSIIKRAVLRVSSPEFVKGIAEEDPEMVIALPIIQEINRKGYITIESQRGFFRPKTKTNERAYVCGFIHRNKASNFIHTMNLMTDKLAVMIPICGNDCFLPASMDLPLTETGGKIRTHMSMALPKMVWESYCKEAELGKQCDEFVVIFCWDPKWNRDALMIGGTEVESDGLFLDIKHCL